MLTLPSPVQPLLGLKVFFTFLFGMAAAGAIAERTQVLPKLALAAFIASVCGVAMDVVIDFPGPARRMSPRSGRFRYRESGVPGAFRVLRDSRELRLTRHPSCSC